MLKPARHTDTRQKLIRYLCRRILPLIYLAFYFYYKKLTILSAKHIRYVNKLNNRSYMIADFVNGEERKDFALKI